MKELLEKLATEGGMIICTSVMDEEMINQSRASNRLWVNDDGIGYSWEPNRLLPTTEEEVRLFEEYYPLPVETPPLDFDELWRRIEEAKRREEIELNGRFRFK